MCIVRTCVAVLYLTAHLGATAPQVRNTFYYIDWADSINTCMQGYKFNHK